MKQKTTPQMKRTKMGHMRQSVHDRVAIAPCLPSSNSSDILKFLAA